MEKLWELISTAGGPTSIGGGVLLLFFYLRRQEAGVRTEINASLVRLQLEKTALQTYINELEAEAVEREKRIDDLRLQLRNAEDESYAYKRRAINAEAQLNLTLDN